MQAYRHGDVVIVPISEDTWGDLENGVRNGQKIEQLDEVCLAEGEITGHSHMLRSEDPTVLAPFESIQPHMLEWGFRPEQNSEGELLRNAGNYRALKLTADASLTHEEHAEIKLPAGHYVVYQQREQWTAFKAPRRVYD